MRATWNNGLFEVAALVVLANDAWAICVSSVGELWGAARGGACQWLRGFDC